MLMVLEARCVVLCCVVGVAGVIVGAVAGPANAGYKHRDSNNRVVDVASTVSMKHKIRIDLLAEIVAIWFNVSCLVHTYFVTAAWAGPGPSL